MYRILIAFLVTIFSSFSLAAGNAVPVVVGGDENLDACSSLGVVSGLDEKGDGFLAVRSGPDISYELLDKLANDTNVFVCNASKNKQWYGVVYTKGNEISKCGVSSPITPAVPYHGKCSSGWVSKKWIKIIAG